MITEFNKAMEESGTRMEKIKNILMKEAEAMIASLEDAEARRQEELSLRMNKLIERLTGDLEAMGQQEEESGVSKSRYFAISISIKYSNFSRFYKKKGPFYKKIPFLELLETPNIRCPVGGSVGGCGAGCISQDNYLLYEWSFRSAIFGVQLFQSIAISGFFSDLILILLSIIPFFQRILISMQISNNYCVVESLFPHPISKNISELP